MGVLVAQDFGVGFTVDLDEFVHLFVFREVEILAGAIRGACVSKCLNVNAALIIDLEIHAMDEPAIATLLFVTALGDFDPLAIGDVIVRAFGHTR